MNRKVGFPIDGIMKMDFPSRNESDYFDKSSLIWINLRISEICLVFTRPG